jgi:N6-L-threonylcarbamoyladenine synthase
MNILAIETSCDETAAAVVKDGREILSNVTATSAGIHARTGGVIPEDAARKQIKAIIPVIQMALSDARVTNKQLDAIAVTIGPGLIGSLLVGVETAKTLSVLWDIPIIPVNHLIGHIYGNWLKTEQKNRKTYLPAGKAKKQKNNTLNNKPQFPALALVVSGGHTDLVLMKDHRKLKWIGGTRDDAAGEAFDKTARLLGIPYPGGPNLSALADKFIAKNPKMRLNMFPRPLIDEDNYDWSFSGLKTAVLRKVNEIATGKQISKMSDYKKSSVSPKVQKVKPRLAAEIQEAIVDSLVTKSIKAIEEFQPKSFLLAGGVAANRRLRKKFVTQNNAKYYRIFHVCVARLCTDNATFVGAAAYFKNKPVNWKNISANPQLTILGEVS